MKKLLSFALIIMLALSFATPVQAATKKVTAEAYEEDKTDYPAIKEGTTKITLKCEKWNGYGCVKFKAKKSGTYKFSMKMPGGPESVLYINKSEPYISDSYPITSIGDNCIYFNSFNGEFDKSAKQYSKKIKLKKGDTVYLSMRLSSWLSGADLNGKATVSIKKVK